MEPWTMWHVIACVAVLANAERSYRLSPELRLMVATVGAGWPAVCVQPQIRKVG